jgi:hypothetical protein
MVLNNLVTGFVLTKILLVLMNKWTAKKAVFAELNRKPPTVLRSALFPSTILLYSLIYRSIEYYSLGYENER